MYRVWLRWVTLPEFAKDECLSCQSQPSLFGAKESSLKKETIKQENKLCSEMCCGHSGLNLARKVVSCWMVACSISKSKRKMKIFCFHLTKGFGCPFGPLSWSIGSDSVKVSPMHICFAYGYVGNLCFNYKNFDPEDLCSKLYEKNILMVGFGVFNEKRFVRLVVVNCENTEDDLKQFFSILEQFANQNKRLIKKI